MIEALKWVQTQFPEYIENMRKSNHHFDADNLNPYHYEGDIWSHTCMVHNMASHYNVCADVKLATVFHDFGKPLARDVKNNKARFFGHEGVSVFLTCQMIQDYINLHKYENIYSLIDVLNVISLHGDFFDLFESEILQDGQIRKLINRFYKDDYKTFIKVLEHLKCDHSGRFYDDEHKGVSKHYIKNLDEFVMEQIHIYDSKHGYTDYIAQKSDVKKESTITVLVGIPCCGKSTWIKNNTNGDDVVISRDDVVVELANEAGVSYKEMHRDDRIDKIVNEKFQKAKTEGRNIIIDKTNMSKKVRRKYLGSVSKTYLKKSIVFYEDLKTCMDRNVHRTLEEKKFIPYVVFKNFMKGFITPFYDEVDIKEYVI